MRAGADGEEATVLRKPRLTVGDLRMEQVERVARPITLVICVAALALSYPQLCWVAGFTGLSPNMRWLFPLVVDAPILVASGVAVAYHDKPRTRIYAWRILIGFLLASWLANGLHAARFADLGQIPLPSPWAMVIATLFAAAPPLAAALGPHMYCHILRNGVRADEVVRARSTAPAHVDAQGKSAHAQEQLDGLRAVRTREDEQARFDEACRERIARGEKIVVRHVMAELEIPASLRTEMQRRAQRLRAMSVEVLSDTPSPLGCRRL